MLFSIHGAPCHEGMQLVLSPRVSKRSPPPIAIGSWAIALILLKWRQSGWCELPLKGTVSQYFRLLVFSWISFPSFPAYTIRAVSNFFKNSLTPVANLPPVSTTVAKLVANLHLNLRISPWIFRKILNGPKGYSGTGGGGGTDSWQKNQEQKISWHCPFKGEMPA